MPNLSTRHKRKRRVLMVAPQPFFRARGTPFSVLHRVRALCTSGYQVDLITYPFGEDVSIEGLRILRAKGVPGVRDVKIGPSIGKLLLDVPLYLKTLETARNGDYDVIHSHEEAAFFAMGIAKRRGLVHIYDMHSSLPQQLSNFRAYNLGVIRRVFERLERRVLSSCDGVITICQDLADTALPQCASKPHSMIENTGDDRQIFGSTEENIRQIHRLEDRFVVLYTGTFEPYQGLDILMPAFAQVRAQRDNAHLLMVGGRDEQIARYRQLSAELGIADSVTFFGTVHPSKIPSFLNASDLIVSPRSQGTNTPLKIYGYLRSGKPLVATNMPTHTQTLDDATAVLVEPSATGIAKGIISLMDNKQLAAKLADNGRLRADSEFSDAAYVRKVAALYASVLGENPI